MQIAVDYLRYFIIAIILTACSDTDNPVESPVFRSGQFNIASWTIVAQLQQSGEWLFTIEGSVTNNSLVELSGVRVIVELANDGGAILGTEQIFANPSTLGPGTTALFTALITARVGVLTDASRIRFKPQADQGPGSELANRIGWGAT